MEWTAIDRGRKAGRLAAEEGAIFSSAARDSERRASTALCHSNCTPLCLPIHRVCQLCTPQQEKRRVGDRRSDQKSVVNPKSSSSVSLYRVQTGTVASGREIVPSFVIPSCPRSRALPAQPTSSKRTAPRPCTWWLRDAHPPAAGATRGKQVQFKANISSTREMMKCGWMKGGQQQTEPESILNSVSLCRRSAPLTWLKGAKRAAVFVKAAAQVGTEKRRARQRLSGGREEARVLGSSTIVVVYTPAFRE